MFNDGIISEELNETESEIFHTITAKLLHVCKRARLDIDPVVAYLCTRVSCSTHNDREKMDRLIKYIKRTMYDVRIIGAKDLRTMLTWIDATYATYPNMRGQTGGTISFGTGVVHGRSSKQKLNAKSSTEAEIIGMSEFIPFQIWMTNFLKYQGYKIDKNVVFQDNQSAIRMETNGRNSCTGNSRHIDIRYFFVKDRIDKGEFEITYCNTEDMIADFFTKPLQGNIFRKFRDMIMGYVNIPSKFFDISKIKERVEMHERNVPYRKTINNINEETSEEKSVIYNNVKPDTNMKKLDLKSTSSSISSYVNEKRNSNNIHNEIKNSKSKENKIDLDSKEGYGNSKNIEKDTYLIPERSNEIIRNTNEIKQNGNKNGVKITNTYSTIGESKERTYDSSKERTKNENNEIKNERSQKSDVIGIKEDINDAKSKVSYVQPVSKLSWADVVSQKMLDVKK